MEFKIAFFTFVSLFRGYLLDCQSNATVQLSYNTTGTPTNLTYHCPYVSLCLYDSNSLLTDSHDNVLRPCCTSCRSNSTENCRLHCCPDIMPCTLPSATPADRHKVCVPLTFRNKYVENGVLAIATCKMDADETETAKCLQEYDFKTEIFDVIPVTDMNNLGIYRNIHCALCNDLNATHFKHWLVRVVCDWSSNVDLTKYSNLLGVMQGDGDCTISYENPYPETNIEQCDYVIDSCNVTGLVATSGQQYLIYKQQCEKEQAPPFLYIKSADMRFKNLGCALCNGLGLADFSNTRPEFPAFSTVLNLDNSHGSDSQPSTACQTGEVFFKTKNLCIEARCSLMRRLQDNACEKAIPVVGSFAYKIIFRLKTDANINIQAGFGLLKQIGEILENLLRSVFSAVTDIVYEAELAADTKEHIPQRVHTIMNARLRWFEVRAKIKNVELHDPEKKLKTLLHLSAKKSFSVIMNEKTSFIRLMVKDDNLYDNTVKNPNYPQCLKRITGFEPCLELFNITEALTSSNNFIVVPYYGKWSDKMRERFYYKPIWMERNILEFRQCPFVEVLKKDLHWTETNTGLQFMNTGFFLSFSEFVYGDNENVIWVCMETYQSLHSSSDRVSLNIAFSSYSISLILVFKAVTSMLL